MSTLPAKTSLARDRGRPGKYLYCLVDGDAPLDLDLLGAVDGTGPIHAIRKGRLAAVVSDAPVVFFAPSSENVAAHARVSELALRDHTVIPFSFGTVFGSEAEVHELLRSAGTAFREVLDSLRGCVEMRVGVVWDRERIVHGLLSDDEKMSGLIAEITGTLKGSTFLQRIRLARRVEEGLERRARDIVDDVYGTLGPLAVAQRSWKLVGDHMIASAAFLVRRADVRAFGAAAKVLGDRLIPDARVEFGGPRPPSAFASIELALERAD